MVKHNCDRTTALTLILPNELHDTFNKIRDKYRGCFV